MDGDPAAEVRPFWSGYVLPLAAGDTIDGFGVGLGGELFERATREGHGYKRKLSASTYETVTLTYTSQYAQLELRHPTTWILRGGYQTWNDLPYAGVGGVDVASLWTLSEERGNLLRAPYAMAASARPIPGTHWRAYGQAYLHPAYVRAEPGGLLERRAPMGVDGGVYADIGVGFEFDDTDRWPVPDAGMRAELGSRIGGTLTPTGAYPLGGVFVEAIRWWSLIEADRLVFGLRVQAEKSVGERPFWEQGVTGGRWRDEIGFEQTLAGYGRIRTRGDGLASAEGELRPHLFVLHLPWFTVDGYASAFAEMAWLYDGWDPGPPLPTLGLGPELLYQRASQIRPFVAWGWRSEIPGGPREAVPLFGLSVMDPL